MSSSSFVEGGGGFGDSSQPEESTGIWGLGNTYCAPMLATCKSKGDPLRYVKWSEQSKIYRPPCLAFLKYLTFCVDWQGSAHGSLKVRLFSSVSGDTCSRRGIYQAVINRRMLLQLGRAVNVATEAVLFGFKFEDDPAGPPARVTWAAHGTNAAGETAVGFHKRDGEEAVTHEVLETWGGYLRLCCVTSRGNLD